MNKTLKTVIIVLIVIVVAGAAVAGVILTQHKQNYISKDEAIEIALQDAGVAYTDLLESGADFEKTKYSVWYEVEFETHSTEYNYDIDAASGEILSSYSEPRD